MADGPGSGPGAGAGAASGFLAEMLQSITDRGRSLIGRPRSGQDAARGDLVALCDALVSRRGEASGVAIAREILSRYEALDEAGRTGFLATLAERYGPDRARIEAAVRAYLAEPGDREASALHAAAEPRRQELIRRLNLAPGGTAALVGMRRDLLGRRGSVPGLEALDADFAHLFGSWFNRGFLELRHVDWGTPAKILHKIIQHEAVHEIGDWEELRRRVEPPDRRCFAFFHPRIPDDPLIFVEVALTPGVPTTIAEVLREDRHPIAPNTARTAVFYSISNCQEGLRGVSFGNFLIKQVVEELGRELPRLETFVTLSPVPGFARWLAAQRAAGGGAELGREVLVATEPLESPGWEDDPATVESLREWVLAAASHYFLRARDPEGRVVDPVARFHLGNGARLERLSWPADLSAKGLREAHGLMVNYLYDLDHIERNHEEFVEGSAVVAANRVRRALRPAAPRGPTSA